jgi:DNA-binding transcriptional MerR regulator
MQFTPTKLYYKIREVAEIIGVEAHVLRFWETEFPSLAPPKSSTGHRTYRPRDIELLLRIKKLLYEEGFTIAGARKRLGAESHGSGPEPQKAAQSARIVAGRQPDPAKDPKPKSDRLNKVKSELENILTLLDRG